MTCSKLAVLNKGILGAFLSLKKIGSKDMNSYFKGLWWLIKQSMTLFKSQKLKIDTKDMNSYFKGLWWLIKPSMTFFKSQKS